MSFIPAASPQYHAPATLKRLDADGRLETVTFDCLFKRHKATELEALDKLIADHKAKGEPNADMAVLHAVCLGWRVSVPGVGEGAKPTVKNVAYSAELAKSMEEEDPGFVAACVRSFYLSTQPAQAAHLAAEKN